VAATEAVYRPASPPHLRPQADPRNQHALEDQPRTVADQLWGQVDPPTALSDHLPDPVISPDGVRQPDDQAVLADPVNLALLVVLETLSPAERLAFVLHDMFGLPFEEIAPMVDRSPATAR
jgi:DNA-directed RNA polymerase specialized sigma24 family protein